MTTLKSIAIGGALAFSTVVLAHADSSVTGTWKVSVGQNDAPCTLTLAADASERDGGSATPANCAGNAASIGAWRAVGSSLELYAPGDDLVAVLTPHGGGYAGKDLADGRLIVIDR